MNDVLYRMGFMNLWQWRTSANRRWGIRVISEPSQEQLTVDDVGEHLRLDKYGSPLEYPETNWITNAIIAAREVAEGLTGLALAPQELELAIDAFPGDVCGWVDSQGIDLHVAPVTSITSVKYLDGDGTELTLDASAYALDNFVSPGIVYPAYSTSWPVPQSIRNAVRIRMTAGYSLPGDSPQQQLLPKSIRAAMLLIVGHLYENRENTSAVKLEEIPMGVTALLERYRIRTSMA